MNRIKIMALGGAAFVLLAGAAQAGQSSAQSSAKERAETRQLNRQQAQATQPQIAVTDAASTSAHAAPSAAPTMPVRTADASPIIAAKPSADGIDPVTVTPLLVAQNNTAPAMAPMALNSMSNPPDKIATARVVDDKGTPIGAVQKVDIEGGKPTDVKIALLGTEQVVALDAGKLSYDISNNVLMAALDKSQIVQMPAEPRS